MSEKNIDAFAARLGDSGLGMAFEQPLCNRYSPSRKGLSCFIADFNSRSEAETGCRDGAPRQCRAAMQRTNLPAVLEEVDSSLQEVTGRVAGLHKHFMGACKRIHLVSFATQCLSQHGC